MTTDLKSWVGRHEQMQEVISPTPMSLLAATLDTDAPASALGDPIPIPWHWLYFLPDAQHSDLGSDGHPPRGLFLPPVRLKRRMFAGGSITVHRPLRVGQGATLTREIKPVERKEGRTGPLVLVTIEIDITGPEGLALSETQTIAYTDTPPEVVSGPAEPILASPWQSEVATDSVLLFRFSAITFNSHRIHYDDSYARQEEGHPGLVVQGPLIALLLTELARNHGINARELRFRMVAAVIVGDVLRLRGTPTPKGADLVAHVSSGATAVRATVLGDAGTKSEFLRHVNRA